MQSPSSLKVLSPDVNTLGPAPGMLGGAQGSGRGQEVWPMRRKGRVPAAAAAAELRAPVGRQLRPALAERKEARTGGCARRRGLAGRASGARDRAGRARRGADGAASCLRRCGGSGTG